MGGAASEVSAATTRVAMEAATWNGGNILETSKKLALRTEASARFEKQLHPELALRAQRLAARMMVELCNARIGGRCAQQGQDHGGWEVALVSVVSNDDGGSADAESNSD